MSDPGSSTIKNALDKVLERQDLSESEAGDVMHALTGEVPPALAAAFLTALRCKGEHADEIRGFAKVMRELDLKLDDGVPDTGIFRASKPDGSVSVFDGINTWGGREPTCIAAGPPMIWDVSQDAQDCNGVLLF